MNQEIASLERVRTAVDTLRLRNIRPTAERVIEAIGGGNKGRVLEHLRTLRAQPEKEQGPPQLVLDIARAALGEIYDAGRQAEADRGRTASERLSRIIDEQDAEIQELGSENASLQMRLDQRASESERCQAEIASLKKDLNEAEAVIAGLRGQLDAAQTSAASSLVSALTRVERLVERGQLQTRGLPKGNPNNRS